MLRFKFLESPFLHKHVFMPPNTSKLNKHKTKINLNQHLKYIYILSVGLFSLLINSNGYAQTYCTPAYIYDCSSHHMISQVELSGETININNSTACSSNGYGDYTNLPAPDLGIGAVYEIKISTSYLSPSFENVAAWIDYNDNGVFESSELLGYDPNGMVGGSSTYTFTVPTNLTPGNYRLRVRLAYSATGGIDPCNNYNYGETEDYLVNIFQFTDCSSAVAGTITSSLASVCANDTYLLSSTGATGPGNGLTYQWQSSPSSTNTWTDIPNAISQNISLTGLVEDTDYRLVVACSFGDLVDISNVITVYANPLLTCYCEPIYTSGEYTSNFTTTGAIENINISHTSLYNYIDYTNTDTITQITGLNIYFDHTYNSFLPNHSAVIWVDWNQNGVFEANEIVFHGNSPSNPLVGVFNIPNNIIPGNYRLRLRSYWLTVTDPQPCNSTTLGSGTDFILRILPLPDCDTISSPPNWSISSNLDTLCDNGNIKLTISQPIVASNISYIFQSSLNGVNWTNLNTANTELSIAINNVNETTQYRAIWLCNGTIIDSTEAITILAVEPPTLLTVEDGQNCGPGVVTLNATTSPGVQVAWYDDINSNVPIHIGNTYITPNLSSDQTYYVSAFVGSPGSPEVFVSNGTNVSANNPQPFNTNYWGSKNQYLIRASELIDAGYSAGVIQEIIFDVVGASGLDMENFTIKIGLTNNNNTTSNFIQNLTTVYTSITPETLTANTEKKFTLDYGFFWDGISNLVIETCFNNSDEAGGHSVRTMHVGHNAATTYSSNENNICANLIGYTSQERPNIKLNILSGCQSNKEEIHAFIRPEVNLNIATHQNLCISPNQPALLDAGSHPNNVSYLWDDGSTGRFREVYHSGIYSVTITNEFGCSASTDLEVTIRQNPEVDLGPDRTLCLGGSIQLDAGPDGITYSWSNGATTRYNDITTPGTYTVLVVAESGCMILDTIEITFSDQEIARFDAIQIQNLGSNTFKFEAISPQNVTDYLWHFGDGNTSITPIPTHTYANNGNYIVRLDASNECGVVSDSIPTHIISIGERENNDQLMIYPNPTNGKIIIKNDAPLPMKEITISDALGRELTTIHIKDHPQQFIKEIDLSPYAAGTYWINIKNNQTSYSRKIQLIK